MRERALIYLVVVLVVINVAALGTIIYQRVVNPFWGGGPSEEVGTPPEFAKDFRLDPTQREALRESRRRIDSLVAPIQAEIGQKRQELLEEMDSDQPDVMKIDRLLAEIGTLQTSIEKTFVHGFIDDSKIFTPDQRNRFLKVINRRTKWQNKPIMGPEQELERGPGQGRNRGQGFGPGGNRDGE